MGKGNKHKKRLKAEKSKIKLKTSAKTKFLPKGLNETKIDFKIKPIVIAEQLKTKTEDEPLSQKKLNVKELFTRLNHYNANVRRDGCEQLKTLVVKHADEILQLHLGQLLHSASQRVLDKENDVRNEAIKIIDAILKNATIDKIAPFFHILLSYLQCSMTNIDKNIQESSLLLLDCLLQHVPILVAKNCNKLLQHYFSLIGVSVLRNDLKSGNVVSGNVGNRLVSVRWRIKVLSRLYRILSAVVDLENNSSNQQKNTTDISFYQNPYSQCNFKLNNDTNQENNNLNKYTVILFPLLYDTWLEVEPRQNFNDNNSSLLNQETGTVLSCIVNIIYLLWMYGKNNEAYMLALFKTNDSIELINHLLNAFPYTQNTQKQKKMSSNVNKLFEINNDPKLLQENLLISYIFAVLNPNLKHKIITEQANNIVSYINKCLVNRNYVPNVYKKYLFLTVKVIAIDNAENWMRKKVNIELLVTNSLHYYNSNESDSDLFHILCDIGKNPNFKSLSAYQTWLTKLPSLLCRNQITSQQIDALVSISKQGERSFQESLLNQLSTILANLTKINITNTNDVDGDYIKLVGMFYYTPFVQRGKLNDMFQYITKNENVKLCRYFKSMIKGWFEFNQSVEYYKIINNSKSSC